MVKTNKFNISTQKSTKTLTAVHGVKSQQAIMYYALGLLYFVNQMADIEQEIDYLESYAEEERYTAPYKQQQCQSNNNNNGIPSSDVQRAVQEQSRADDKHEEHPTTTTINSKYTHSAAVTHRTRGDNA